MTLQLFALEKANRLFFVNGNRCTQGKNTSG
jgi:hypothetical protein